MTKEHIGLSLALKLPIFIVLTKIDICNSFILKKTIDEVHKLLKLPGVRKIPFHVKTIEDVIICSKNLSSDRICPIFSVSNVTGLNLPLLRLFLNILPIRQQWEEHIGNDKPREFLIDQTFFVTGVGTVVSGICTSGTININDYLFLGPDSNGLFKKVQIKSIHRNRVAVKSAHAGQSCSFSLKKEKKIEYKKRNGYG
jgi:GTPase